MKDIRTQAANRTPRKTMAGKGEMRVQGGTLPKRSVEKEHMEDAGRPKNITGINGFGFEDNSWVQLRNWGK